MLSSSRAPRHRCLCRVAQRWPPAEPSSRMRRRIASRALNRPAEMSHARGLAGTPSCGHFLQRGPECIVQRVLGEVEVAPAGRIRVARIRGDSADYTPPRLARPFDGKLCHTITPTIPERPDGEPGVLFLSRPGLRRENAARQGAPVVCIAAALFPLRPRLSSESLLADRPSARTFSPALSMPQWGYLLSGMAVAPITAMTLTCIGTNLAPIRGIAKWLAVAD